MKSLHLQLPQLVLFTILLCASMLALAQEPEKKSAKSAFNKTQRNDIEVIVREYLLKNPTLIQEVLQAQKAQDESLSARKTQQAILAYRDALQNDPNSPVVGNPKGDITIVEFFDYRCGYCKQVSPVLAELIAKDPDVRVVFKDFPILGPDSVYAASAALAAQKQKKYTEFHNALMTSQTIDEDGVKSIATKLGMDEKRLLLDMQDASVKKIIDDNYNLANMLNISGTPAFVVGDRIVPGATDLSGLIALVSGERIRLKSQVK